MLSSRGSWWMGGIVGLFTVLLAGCSALAPTVEPVTIRFACPVYDRAYYEPLIQEFSKSYPQTTVELVTVPANMWPRRVGDLEDVDVFLAPDSLLTELVAAGNVLSLEPFIEQDKSFDAADYYPGVLENLSGQGQLWAVPAGLDPLVMYYNQDLFDRYGVAYPTVEWTWDDFLNIVVALRDPDAGIYGYAPSLDVFDTLPFIYQHGGRLAEDLRDPTQATFDDPRNIEALQWYVDLMYEYEAVPTPEQARRAFGGGGEYVVARGFLTEKLAMFASFLSQRGGRGWPTEWPMRWGMAPLPRDMRSATVAMVEGYFISAQAQHPEVCWQWIMFLNQQTATRLVPPRRSLVESAEYESAVGKDAAAVIRAAVGSDVLLLEPTSMPQQAQQAFGILQQALSAAINGRATPEEALGEAQRQVEALSQP